MTPLTVLIVEPFVPDARFIEDSINEAVETGATSLALRPVHLEHLDDALIVLAEERVEAVVLGCSIAPLRDLSRVADVAPHVPVLLTVDSDDRRTGLVALRQGAQEYLIRGEFDYVPLARAIESAIERQKMLHSWRALAMRDVQTGLLSRAAFCALCERGRAAELVVGRWDAGKLSAEDAAAAWSDAVGHEAWPARVGLARLAAVLSGTVRPPDVLRESLSAATGVDWSVESVKSADLVRE